MQFILSTNFCQNPDIKVAESMVCMHCSNAKNNLLIKFSWKGKYNKKN